MSLFLVKEEMARHMPDEGLGAGDLQAWSTLNCAMKPMTVSINVSEICGKVAASRDTLHRRLNVRLTSIIITS